MCCVRSLTYQPLIKTTLFFPLLLFKNKAVNPSSNNSASPPITPPTIAPAFGPDGAPDLLPSSVSAEIAEASVWVPPIIDTVLTLRVWYTVRSPPTVSLPVETREVMEGGPVGTTDEFPPVTFWALSFVRLVGEAGTGGCSSEGLSSFEGLGDGVVVGVGVGVGTGGGGGGGGSPASGCSTQITSSQKSEFCPTFLILRVCRPLGRTGDS
jgi:hypothetical protein